jgi:hypothetical protein
MKNKNLNLNNIKIDVEEGYKRLKPWDIIKEGDEYSKDNGLTWIKITK